MKAGHIGRGGLTGAVLAVGLLGGCKWCHKVPLPTIRGQAPMPAPETATGTPPSPSTPLQGQPPLSPAAGVAAVPASGSLPDSSASVVQSGFYTARTAIHLHELLQQAAPRIKIAALVGSNTVITDQEVRESVYQRLAEYRHLPGPLRTAKQNELYAAELRRIIERELLLADMHARLKKAGKLSVLEEIREFAEKNADRTLAQIRKNYGAASEEDFLAILRAQGLTLAIIRRQLTRQIMADEYARTLLKDRVHPPGFAEIRAYYESHPEEFRTEDWVRWQHLFLSFARHPSESATREKAAYIRQQALEGIDFVALIQQHDQGLAAGNGGWGLGQKRGEIQPPDLEAIVWSLRPGEVSEVISTASGCHLIRVVDRQYAGVRPFDAKVQDEIRDKLQRKHQEQEYYRLIAELWRTGGVQIVTDQP